MDEFSQRAEAERAYRKNFPTGECAASQPTPDLQSKPASGYISNRKIWNEAYL